jgi:hypothetical protein
VLYSSYLQALWFPDASLPSISTLWQWRNVISGGPRFKIFEGPPLVEVPKARVERRICTSFLGVQGMLIRKSFESRVSEMPFPRLWGEILQNSDGQKTTLWHIRGPGQCFCSTAWAWGPPFGPLWLGAPGFARSEPIVVTLLLYGVHIDYLKLTILLLL